MRVRSHCSPSGGEQCSLVPLQYWQCSLWSLDPLIHYSIDSVHFDPLIQEMSVRHLHCLTLFSYMILRGQTLNLCRYLMLPQTSGLVIDLFTSLWICGFLSVSYNPLLSVFIFQLIVPDLTSGSWLLCSLYIPIILWTLLVFRHKKMVQAHLGLSLTQPGIGFPRSLSGKWYLEAKI